ncbi:sigma-70 family RNA polymerase sigma factor [Waterburya agarophytonicola K14]|uniref:Sigma-70 family RNA polymerase sigma factor n=1 Tax=Waterburya agarophytonicola KI4 TaxID=2874699 RepID=A0A964FGY2_9CYAN|nr:sigma-70 family RNA polymerase sigma factor [Waterburya agarophytonicola]MCC0178586.1 sigma-70 family RNA polymerase sigma factor [Waterburya agarophytonicola KI4]
MSSEAPSNYSEDNNLHQTDANLFVRLQNGETDTLAILYDRHVGLVYGISWNLLGNTAEAEDLTQDIFLNLTKKCSYDPQRGSLRTYLRILTRSRALDRLRSRSRQQRIRNQALNENAKVLSESPMEEAVQIERSHKIVEALKQLSIKEREVLRMAYYQGLSQSEIAQRLGTALGTVKSRTRRGLLKLRQALTDSRDRS